MKQRWLLPVYCSHPPSPHTLSHSHPCHSVTFPRLNSAFTATPHASWYRIKLSVLDNLGQCFSTDLPKGYLAVSGEILGRHDWEVRAFWHLMGRGQGWCYTLNKTALPPTKNYLVQNLMNTAI